MTTINSKKYYFYIDEGGIFGACNIAIKEREILPDPMKEGLYSYFFSYLPLSSIRHHIYLFRKVYPECPIFFDELSDIKYNKEELSDYNLNPGM